MLTRVTILMLLCLIGECAEATPESPLAFSKITHNALRHVKSGFVFPSNVGRFYRLEPYQYDSTGDDISVGYNNDQNGVVATIYVYPAHGTLADELVSRQAEISSHHPTAKLLSTSTLTIAPQQVKALSATYIFDELFMGKVQRIHSKLVVAQTGTWFVEYRFSYPAQMQAPAMLDVINFESTFAWP